VNKRRTVELLGSFGWPAERVIDLGDITAARAADLYVALWGSCWAPSERRTSTSPSHGFRKAFAGARAPG
jgi:hypothetical protein